MQPGEDEDLIDEEDILDEEDESFDDMDDDLWGDYNEDRLYEERRERELFGD